MARAGIGILSSAWIVPYHRGTAARAVAEAGSRLNATKQGTAIVKDSYLNGLKTAALLGVLSAVIIGIGSIFGSGDLIIGLVLALGMNAFSYFYSDKLALRSMRAQSVTGAQAPELYAIVRELAGKAGQPMPRLYVSPTSQPNAFATRRSPAHAAVLLHRGHPADGRTA